MSITKNHLVGWFFGTLHSMIKFYTLILVGTFLLLNQTAHAGEIQYGHIEEIHDTEIHIQYKGPGGEQNFVCDVQTLDCESFGTTTPELFPKIEDSTDYPNSKSGRYGISEVVDDEGVTYTLYDVSGSEAVEVAVLPYTKETNAYKFPWVDDHFILFGTDGTVTTYDIETEQMTEITPSQSEFPMRSLSPHASYLAAYNYVDEAHKIWDTESGEEISIPSATPAYVEFSQNEQYAAFADGRDGYQTIYTVDLIDEKQRVKRVFKDDFTVEDYLWFKDRLYVVGNTEKDPYRWVLYQYNPDTKRTKIISEDVSYGDYIRPIGEHALSFLVIEGKNSHVALYNAERNRVDVIRPVEVSAASKEIERSVVDFGDGLKGVLYEPENPDRRPDLFVWLHGGPMRQTSFGYHSYLSYAVYDELLERLVESGAYVLKLDYAGSYGHGSEFMDQLSTRLGDIDVEHVIDATREIEDDYNIDDVYLIGNSYGGYLGPKALVESERDFNGAIAINGVFDWFDLLARIPSSPFKTHFNGLADLEDLDVNFEMFEDASIVRNLPKLGKLKQLLLIYGEDDATVPTWQTEEFFYQAKMLDKNVDLLKLEGEDHIIRKRENLDLMCETIADKLLIKDLDCTK